jgi:hypothetical protein
VTVKEAAEALARAIGSMPKPTHFLVRDHAYVAEYLEEHGTLPPGVSVHDPDEPGVVVADIGGGGSSGGSSIFDPETS